MRTLRNFRGNVYRRTAQFVPLVSEIPPGELPRLLEDLRKVGAQIGGVMMVAKSDIHLAQASGSPRNIVLDNIRSHLQAQIDRADKAIASGHLIGEDLAAVLCSRANARDDLGVLLTEALTDARNAVKAAEQSGVAWTCLADAEYVRGDFIKAEQAYSRALPLVDEPARIYYKRGQVRFYQGKLAEAVDDFAQSAAVNPDESRRMYAQMWQIWTLQRLGKALPADLVTVAAREPRGPWPRPALALLVGLLTVDEMLTEVQRKQGDERELDLAEAWFYIGQHHFVNGRKAEAYEAFEKVIGKGVTMYIEHTAAGFELRLLGRKPVGL